MKSLNSLSDAELTDLASEASQLEDAPRGWVGAAVALWKVAPRPAPQAPRLWTRIAAALSFDSWATPQLALGMRSTAVDNRHLLYSAEGRDIDLRITHGVDRFALTGQVLGPDESGEVVLSSQSGKPGSSVLMSARLDSLGEFRLDGVDQGTYQLTLRMGVEEIVLPPIVIGQTSA
ncbi:MAG: hypothetical protein ABL900_03705 [Burkholderiaceae bacterium]